MTTLGRIDLVPFTASDAQDAFIVWSDFETVKFTNWDHTPSFDECAKKVEKVLNRYGSDARHFGPYTIRLEDGRFAGLAGADLQDESQCEYEVWYILRRDEWGKGIATRALGELVHRMVASGRVKKVMATAVAENAASCIVLEKNGFTQRRMVAGGFQKHGLTRDLFVYDLS